MAKKIRITLSGVGNRALPKQQQESNWLGWVELIKRSDKFELVAAQDIAGSPLKRLTQGYLPANRMFADFNNMLNQVDCDAVLVANPAQCHAETIKQALRHNLHILVEKPFVTDLSQGKEIIRTAEKQNRVLAVAQSWRCKDVGQLLYQSIQKQLIGRVGYVFFRYIRNRENSNYPAYIFEEAYPLLYAMGIHHLDLLRYVLQDEMESVSGSSFKPPWSLYQSDTGVNLYLKTKSGVVIIYSGSISSQNNAMMQESLVIEGEKGTLVNESLWSEPPLWLYLKGKRQALDLSKEIKNRSIKEQYNTADQRLLDNFYAAITRQERIICSAADALNSVAVLEAGRLACETGKSVFLRELI